MDVYKNIFDLQEKAKQTLEKNSFDYLAGGADDERTLNRNITAFRHFQIRPRRLVDVRNIDTTVHFFGKKYESPIVLAPVGLQGLFHPEAEIASAKAAAQAKHLMMTSTVSTRSYDEICAAVESPPWFQLYPTSNRTTTKMLLDKATRNGCEVLVLTVDVPVAGNREKHIGVLTGTMSSKNTLGNFPEGNADFAADLTWNFIAWLRENITMKILIKGIMTAEDAVLCLQHGADGIIISNHGGRQLESDLSTIEILEEVVEVIQKKIPVMLDGGIRRGSDIFKALAMGADAVCIGRPYIYGLAAEGQKGVEKVLEILQTELVRNMQIAGVTSLANITPTFVQHARF